MMIHTSTHGDAHILVALVKGHGPRLLSGCGNEAHDAGAIAQLEGLMRGNVHRGKCHKYVCHAWEGPRKSGRDKECRKGGKQKDGRDTG